MNASNQSPYPSIEFRTLSSISQVNESDWNALIPDNNPFLLHAFLSALETHQCVGEHFGWIPCHLVGYENNRLVAAMPFYEKYNYYGEFVFDQAWEDAWNSVGLPYYPKLVSAVPYTPAHGPRLMVQKDHPETHSIRSQMIEQLKHVTDDRNMSGFHLLFSDLDTQAWLKNEKSLLHRLGYQFHWFNQNYTTFDDFLNQLTAKKRKNIRQERQAIQKSGIHFKVLNGHTATEQDWDDFGLFYNKTFLEKWSTPTLNTPFFKALAETMPEHIVLIMAHHKHQNIAGSLCFCSDTHLYGRHWGTRANVKHLHFETCFYQGIDYAITHNLNVFEPGAGGEHKIARGFIPIETFSSHYLFPNPFEDALCDFIDREAAMVRNYLNDIRSHSPYQSVLQKTH